MSNIPAHIQAMLDKKAGIASTDEMVVSVSVPRISTKGNRLKAINGDDEFKLGDEFTGIIVGISPEGQAKAKTFYAAGWTEDSHEAPDCSSANGVIPDSWVSNPQHKVCATCQQNQWGSAESKEGKSAKACKESKRLHVVLAKDMLLEDPTVYVLSVTVNTFKNFTAYGAHLRKLGLDSPFYVVTKFKLDEESSVPRLQFEMVEFLDEKPMLQLLPIAESKPWQLTTQPALSHEPSQSYEKLEAPSPKETVAPVTNSDVEDLVNKWE
jgi:hypothetical protein